MKTAAQSVTWYSNLLKTLLWFFFFPFFLLGDSTQLYDQTFDSHFQVILHDFHTEEVLNMRFQETSQACYILLFSPA